MIGTTIICLYYCHELLKKINQQIVQAYERPPTPPLTPPPPLTPTLTSDFEFYYLRILFISGLLLIVLSFFVIIASKI